jgi:integrase/recombinase XerC
VRTIKAFGTWVANELDLPANPVRSVPLPRVPDQLIPSLRDHEIVKLLEATSGSRDSHRDRALVLLLIDTGMRVSEIASLTVGDIDLVDGRCRVMGKGRHERVVPIGRRTSKAIRIWLARHAALSSKDALFRGAGDEPLTARGDAPTSAPSG